MAGVITHIYIAEIILKRNLVTVKDEAEYYLGSIAPDAIMAKKNYVRDDKKTSHLRDNISSDRWYQDQYKKLFEQRLQSFYKEHVINQDSDFALGYYIHLLTDQAFHYSFRDDIVETLKSKNLPYEKEYLRDAMIYELNALDYDLLSKNKHILDILLQAKKRCNLNHIDGLVSSETLCKNFEWIDRMYTKDSKVIPPIHFNDENKNNIFNYVIEHIATHLDNVKGGR